MTDDARTAAPSDTGPDDVLEDVAGGLLGDEPNTGTLPEHQCRRPLRRRARERALRAGLADFELGDEDLATCSRRAAARCRRWSGRPAAGGRRRRPPERRQVHPGQPDPRPPRGRRRGRPRGHPRPRHLRRRVGGPPLHPRRHRRLGARRRRASTLRVAEQAEIAVDLADVVLFVVDATVGRDRRPTRRSCRLLRRPGKPVVLAANKVDDQRTEAEAAALWNLGLGEPYPVSALHGRGIGDLLDAVLDGAARGLGVRRGLRARRPAPGRAPRPAERRQVLAAEQAGRRGARRRRRRRRHHPRPGRRADRARRQALAVRRHRRHPPPGAPDPGRRLLRLAAHPGRAREGRGRRRPARRRASRSPSRTSASSSRSSTPAARWSSPTTSGTCSTRSAATTSSARSSGTWCRCSGRRGSTSPPAPAGTSTGSCRPSRRALESWDTRIPTGRLNAFLGELVAAHPHPVRGGKQPRILFGTQADTRPPRFVLFATGLPRGRLPPVHRAPAARGVRLRGHPDRDLGAGAREARAGDVGRTP